MQLRGLLAAAGMCFAIATTPAAAKDFYKLGDLDARSACDAWRGEVDNLRAGANFWHRALLLASLSAAAYRDLAIGAKVTTDSTAGGPINWRVVDRIEKQPDESYNTGVVAYAFQNVQSGEVVIAVRGSEGENDWLRNLAEHGTIGDQHMRLWRFARYVASVYGRDFHTLTGHSRGGQLAAFGALMTGREALIFNASILPDDFASYAKIHGRPTPAITNVQSAIGDNFNITKIRIPDLISISSNLVAFSRWYPSTRQIAFGGDYSYFTQVNDMKNYWITLADTDWLGAVVNGNVHMAQLLWKHPLTSTIYDLHSIERQTAGLSRVVRFLDRGLALASSCR